MVRVGFLSALLTNGAASVTKRFLTSQAWQYWFNTDFFGSSPILRCADFVDDLAAARNTPVVLFAVAVRDHTAHGLDDLFEGLLHVLGLQDLILAPFEVEPQNRNAPLIDNLRIDLAIAVFVRNHFAAAREVDLAAVELAQILLHLDAIAAAQQLLGDTRPARPRRVERGRRRFRCDSRAQTASCWPSVLCTATTACTGACRRRRLRSAAAGPAGSAGSR